MDELIEEEVWTTIEEFPRYSVSTYGQVANNRTEKILSQSPNSTGVVRVGLVDGDGNQLTRSVKVLVAETFIPKPEPRFNTPINLDGNPENNHVGNLMWRPRNYAWKYARQFTFMPPISEARYSEGPIIELTTETVYPNVMEAGIANGVTFFMVWCSCREEYFKKAVWPDWLRFEYYTEEY